jgi:hypothetical protein
VRLFHLVEDADLANTEFPWREGIGPKKFPVSCLHQRFVGKLRLYGVHNRDLPRGFKPFELPAGRRGKAELEGHETEVSILGGPGAICWTSRAYGRITAPWPMNRGSGGSILCSKVINVFVTLL